MGLCFLQGLVNRLRFRPILRQILTQKMLKVEGGVAAAL